VDGGERRADAAKRPREVMRCALVPDPARGACRCPDGAVETDDGAGCTLVDGGFVAFPDAGLLPDAGPADSAPLDSREPNCTEGESRSCSSIPDVGECSSCTQTCIGDEWGPCSGGVGPTPERCDGLDNDCDSAVDGPAASAACGTPLRATSAGCSGGECVVLGCTGSFLDCDGDFSNGCESELGSEAACGGCGDVCGWRCSEASCDDAEEVASGSEHSCAIRESGAVVCWGSNLFGQLGDGGETGRTAPVPVLNLSRIESVSTGASHSCAVGIDGTASCWGANRRGQLGNASNVDRNEPVLVSGLSLVRSISAGFEHTCACRSNGVVECWGLNVEGQLGDGTTSNRNAPAAVTGISTAVRVAVGATHSCAVLSNGSVRCWGGNRNGELGDGTTTRRTNPVVVPGITTAREIAVGNFHSCVLLDDGSVRCWGANDLGQVGDGGPRSDRVNPSRVSGLLDVVAIAASSTSQHTCALRSDQSVLCWGDNAFGQLGDGSMVGRDTPVLALSDAKAISVGVVHSCAVTLLGGAMCWGDNTSGQLGDGTTEFRSMPVAVRAP
jgi:alpha-tubulin suppressor-like RCC1 family protein